MMTSSSSSSDSRSTSCDSDAASIGSGSGVSAAKAGEVVKASPANRLHIRVASGDIVFICVVDARIGHLVQLKTEPVQLVTNTDNESGSRAQSLEPLITFKLLQAPGSRGCNAQREISAPQLESDILRIADPNEQQRVRHD